MLYGGGFEPAAMSCLSVVAALYRLPHHAALSEMSSKAEEYV
jgi:hypothetical protein